MTLKSFASFIFECRPAILSLLLWTSVHSQPAPTVLGYRGIWFTLGQYSEHGDKYSGGLGTYTAKHHPLAVFSPEAKKTFFVYGGTTSLAKTHLLAMISYYDHVKDEVPIPRIVHDKKGVDDPHDNPSLSIDGSGHLWVFVSGRSTRRPGHIYRSCRPYDIDEFQRVKIDTFAYPQPWWIDGKGFLFLFTRYTRGRELYWAVSPDGQHWSSAKKLASGGHYQMSNRSGPLIGTAFNSHPGDRNVDGRTNLYYIQTTDFGKSWTTVDGKPVQTPVEPFGKSALVRDYQYEQRLVYLKDIVFDLEKNPVLLYITSGDYKAGPESGLRIWTIAKWTGEKWHFSEITTSTHNYDMGSLYIEEDGTWRLIAPTETGPQKYGTGGEVAVWTSPNGTDWQRVRRLTRNSRYNHAYVRRPLHAHPGFYAFWADGNPDSLSASHLYFTDRTGASVRQLPYNMDGTKRPITLKYNK